MSGGGKYEALYGEISTKRQQYLYYEIPLHVPGASLVSLDCLGANYALHHTLGGRVTERFGLE